MSAPEHADPYIPDRADAYRQSQANATANYVVLTDTNDQKCARAILAAIADGSTSATCFDITPRLTNHLRVSRRMDVLSLHEDRFDTSASSLSPYSVTWRPK
jgi:hypothetical protein